MRTIRFLLMAGLGLCLLASSGCPTGPEADAAQPDAWVTIGDSRVAVEIADEPDEQALGLGERDALPIGQGMYFVYDRPAFYAFWMKGMRFPIDIVWIRQGRIIDLTPNVPFEPGGNGPTVRPKELTDAVLEVPAGYAAAEGWQIGDRVKLERLGRN